MLHDAGVDAGDLVAVVVAVLVALLALLLLAALGAVMELLPCDAAQGRCATAATTAGWCLQRRADAR